MKVLVVDNFDSFTHMLVDYLQQAGADCRVIRNDKPVPQLTNEPVDAVVLSPGPGTPQQAGQLMNIITHFHQRVPMLGVCLGHQALGEFFGAQLTLANRPMHGKISTIHPSTDDILWRGLPASFQVTRYHSLVLTDLPSSLVQLAIAESNETMAIRHQTLPLWGVQFHPEATLTQHGVQLLKNWINFVLFIKKEKESATSLIPQYV